MARDNSKWAVPDFTHMQKVTAKRTDWLKTPLAYVLLLIWVFVAYRYYAYLIENNVHKVHAGSAAAVIYLMTTSIIHIIHYWIMRIVYCKKAIAIITDSRSKEDTYYDAGERHTNTTIYHDFVYIIENTAYRIFNDENHVTYGKIYPFNIRNTLHGRYPIYTKLGHPEKFIPALPLDMYIAVGMALVVSAFIHLILV